jgi:hypothetical protein
MLDIPSKPHPSPTACRDPIRSVSRRIMADTICTIEASRRVIERKWGLVADRSGRERRTG